MANAGLGCKMAMVGANSCPGCINRLRKHYPDLVGGSFLVNQKMLTILMSEHDKRS